MYLALLRLIFALKREIAPPKDREMRSRSGCQLTEKRSEFQGRLFLLGDHLILDRKTHWISVKTTLFYFFGDHLILDRKTLWICLNPIEYKSKFGSRSFTVESNFKKAPPPLRNPGYATVVPYAFFVMVRIRYVGTIRFKNWSEVRYAGTVRLKVRGT